MLSRPVLKGIAQVTVLNMEDFEADAWAGPLAESTLVAVLSSTYGPGAPPRTAAKFVAWLQRNGEDVKDTFKGKKGAAWQPACGWWCWEGRAALWGMLVRD